MLAAISVYYHYRYQSRFSHPNSAPHLKDKETLRLPAVVQSRWNDSPQAGKPGGPGTVRMSKWKISDGCRGEKYSLESR